MAYGALDFNGKGFILEQDFLNCQVVKERTKFSKEQIKVYFKEFNLFPKNDEGLSFDNFKKNFFPHLYLVQEDKDDADDLKAMNFRQQVDSKSGQDTKMLEERLVKLEKKLKEKFSNCYESVRKAFLALDTDYDGYITVEDILKYFGNEKDLNYNDLKKLMIDKDSKKQGRIGYSDFSKWLGNAIHLAEGFYFRHDSVKNPMYELNLDKQARNKESDKHQAAQLLLKGDVEQMILEKMKF